MDSLSMPTDEQVPFHKISAFVRKLAHDLRNNINSSNLEVTYLADCVEDPELLDSLTKIQEDLRELDLQLRNVSRKFANPSPQTQPTPASLIPELWKEAMENLSQLKPSIQFSETIPDVFIDIDVDDIIAIAAEILKNTSQHGSLSAAFSMHIDEGTSELAIEYLETSILDAPSFDLGRKPFISTQPENHGLGLFMASRLARANSGSLQFRYQAATSKLKTELRFPLVPPPNQPT